ncbi:DUF4838 domain-containing protein [Chitinophaga lutea]
MAIRTSILAAGLALCCGRLSGQEKITLVKNGASTYKIYAAASAPESVKAATQDLKNYIEKVTGATLQVTDVPPAGDGGYISVGDNALSAAAGIQLDAVKYDGFRIVTKGKNVFILGPDTKANEVSYLGGASYGSSNGVYAFIGEYLGVDWLIPGPAGEYYTKSPNLSIPSLNRTVSPVFNYRVLSQTVPSPNLPRWERAMKLGKFAAVKHEHSWEHTIPAAAFKTHPDWFAQSGGKPLPPSGTYKLETTNPELVQAFADEVIKSFRANPDQRWYSLSPSDGVAWSDSEASKALYQKDPYGKLSLTKMVLQFYNDVAKIVRKEFPDRRLGGYIYAQYLYPPEDGIPRLEPNLSLVVATSVSYGFQLNRPETQQNWDNIMKAWGEASQKSGFDVYYYDLPTVLMQSVGIITPPSPDILNYVFARLSKYGYKGLYFYGMAIWPSFGPLNHTIAQLEWNPGQDAAELLRTYYRKAYGERAAPHVEKLFALLDSGFRKFYLVHPNATYNLTYDHLKDIYAPAIADVEKSYLAALDAPKDTAQQYRLSLMGNVLALQQWNLKTNNLLDASYRSRLTRTDEEIDRLLSEQNPDFNLQLSAEDIRPEPPVNMKTGARTLSANPVVPTFGRIRMLLYKTGKDETRIQVKRFASNGEFVVYRIRDTNGKMAATGAMRADKTIRFSGSAQMPYIVDINNRGSFMQTQVEGSAVAYKTNAHGSGFRVSTGDIEGDSLSLFFFVPENIRSFSLTLANGPGQTVRIEGPEKSYAGLLQTGTAAASRLEITVPPAAEKERCWKITLYKFKGKGPQIAALTLDAQLPQWFATDGSALRFE